MAPMPGTAEAPALSQETVTPAPMADAVANSGTQSGPGGFDLDAAVSGVLAMTPEELAALEAPAAPVEPETPPETDPQDDPDTESEPGTATAPETGTRNFRMRVTDPKEAEVLAMKRRNPDMPLPDIMAKVYGKPAEPAAPEAAPVVPVVVTEPEVATLQARKSELKEELAEAVSLMDKDRVAEITVELSEMPFLIREAERAAEARKEAEAKAQAEFDAATQESEIAVKDYFPSLLVVGSPEYNTYVEVSQSLPKAIQESPQFAMLAAIEAARKLGIAPAAPKSSSPSAAVPEPRAPIPARPRPASGTGAAPVAAVRPDYSKMSLDELDARVRAITGG